jgi:hypothetical protein
MITQCDGKPIAIAGYAGTRLREDSARQLLGAHAEEIAPDPLTMKRRVVINRANGSGVAPGYPIHAVFLLTDPAVISDEEKLIKTPIGSCEFMRLVGACLSLDPTDKALLRTHFQRVSKISHTIEQLYSVQYPRRFGFLPTLLDQLLADSSGSIGARVD